MTPEENNSWTSGEAETLPVPVANPKYTIAPRRLAGSPACMNCGTGLVGPFCHYCGQPDKNLMRFFPVLMRELLEDFLDFDSRFMRTLKPLLFKPGRLTRDYLDGKRFRYVPPLRLYIFASLACFFLAAGLAGLTIKVDPKDGNTQVSIGVSGEDEEEVRKALEQLREVRPDLADDLESSLVDGEVDPDKLRESAIEAAQSEAAKQIDFDVGGKPWHRETNPLIVPFMPNWVNEWINDEIEESPQKGKAIAQDPGLIWDKVWDVLPGTMFVLLPMVALLLKFWYLFARKYYVEHLIFALHNHAFIFVCLLLMILLSGLAGWQDPGQQAPITAVATMINIALAIWIPVYLLVSLKRVYGQGWALTILKYGAIGTSYLFLLSLVTAFVALLSFVLL